MALATNLPQNASNSVAVHFQAGEYPRNLEETTALFSKFGDVARLDTTLGPVTGLVFVTFFDVRCALKVLSDFKGRAEPFPPAAHDFRAVSILTNVLSTLPASFAGFQSFGEIAGVSVQGENMVVEFYDIRAAQQVTYSLPASRPRRSLPSTPSDSTSPPELLKRPTTEPFKETYTQERVQLKVDSPMSLLKANSNDLSLSQGLSGLGEALSVPNFSGNGDHRRGTSGHAAQGKPIREKVRTQDLLKFDIVPEKIRAGEDPRTTVMVRNIPKACTREAFVQLLVPCGLEDRYTFFYMPFDKRRNIHCGFAFINFRTPMDVLTLFEKMASTLWRCLAPAHGISRSENAPAVSYARLQGQDQLMKHFSLSAVMHDSDARKRPMFCQESGQHEYDIEEQLEELMKDDAVRDAVLKAADMPRYVSLDGTKDIENPWAGDGRFASDSLAFLMSHHSGA
jgi:hypothetical protein